MAKKGQTVQLQTELNTDEEWEKYLEKPGLLVIDVYSDWCGPCAGMQANLKKIKVEIGGDTLQLAIAKCDGITALERFRGTSEPTWMLVSGGKMVNFMYGANAPKLTRLITEELRIQKMVEEGTFVRENVLEVTERAPEDAKRYEVVQAAIAEEEALEAAKKAEEIRLRLLKESDAILENLGNLGVIVVFPHAKEKFQEIMKELMSEAGLVVSISEKMRITPEHIEGISYFLQEDESLHFNKMSLDYLYDNDCQVMVVKAGHGAADMEDPVSVRILDVMFGPSREPPGDEDCPYARLIRFPSAEAIRSALILASSTIIPVENESSKLLTPGEPADPKKSHVSVGAVGEEDEDVEEEEEEKEDQYIIGMWAPPTRRILSSCFKILFPRMAGPLLIPEPPSKPPHISVCFPIDKKSKIQELMDLWPSEVERYGVFSSCVAEEAHLVAKSFKKYDRSEVPKKGNEKIVIQLSRRRSECLLAFAIEIPTYMSPNVKEGKRECKLFFPEEYDEPPEPDTPEEEVIVYDDDEEEEEGEDGEYGEEMGSEEEFDEDIESEMYTEATVETELTIEEPTFIGGAEMGHEEVPLEQQPVPESVPEPVPEELAMEEE